MARLLVPKFKVGDIVVFTSQRVRTFGRQFNGIIKQVYSNRSIITYEIYPCQEYTNIFSEGENHPLFRSENELKLYFQSVEDGEVTRA